MPSTSPFDLSHRTALVTGAGRGLGAGMARALAAAGANVALVARNQAQLASVATEIAASGGQARPVPHDVSDGSDADALIARVADEVGQPDVLVHAAGIQVRAAAEDLALADWDRVHAIHLRAAFALASAIARPLLAAQRSGSLILIGSLTSRIGLPNTVAYGAAKTGTVGLARALSAEWSRAGIRANVILPGYFHTELTDVIFQDDARREALAARIPMGRFGTPEDLGGAAVFLASDAAGYITGQELAVDGGWLGA